MYAGVDFFCSTQHQPLTINIIFELRTKTKEVKKYDLLSGRQLFFLGQIPMQTILSKRSKSCEEQDHQINESSVNTEGITREEPALCSGISLGFLGGSDPERGPNILFSPPQITHINSERSSVHKGFASFSGLSVFPPPPAFAND